MKTVVSGIEMQNTWGNTFTNNTANSNGSQGFRLTNAKNNTFTGNTANLNGVPGNSNGGCGFFLVIAGGTGSNDNTFTNNTANSNVNHGIRIDSSSGNTLTGNTCNSNGADGIKLKTAGNDTTLENNTCSSNAIGIEIASAGIDATTLTVTHNNISGNTNYGVSNAGTGTLDAENNWWGKTSGPVLDTLPTPGYKSYGDKVTNTNVDYEPWLLAAVTPGVTPTTYDRTLALKNNWTLVSTDREVTTGTTWEGTAVLADSTAKIMAYKYTGTGFTGVTLATLTLLNPADAYYIKTSGGGGIGINYSTAQPGVVTRNLVEGWNLISCGGETDAYNLLSPLRYAQIGNQQGVGLTSLIGQGGDYNQFTHTISQTLVTDAEWTAIDDGSVITLSPFDGYWVYLNAAKLFGVIPFTPLD